MPAIDTAAPCIPGSAAPRPLELYPSLWAIASDVPLSRYGPERLEAHLHDLDWVAEIGVCHEAVIERVAALRGATVVPMKLFTMFSTTARALEDLRGRRRDISAILRRVRGCQEWGVRVTQRASAPSHKKTAPTVSSGTAFLAAKKRARDEAHDRLARSGAAAEEAFASLSAHARATVRREPPNAATSPPLVDAAFLVSTACRARFRAAATRAAAACRDAGAALSVTGPWAPYNFIAETRSR